MPLDWRERMENNGAVLEQSAIPPPYALLWEVRLRKPWDAVASARYAMAAWWARPAADRAIKPGQGASNLAQPLQPLRTWHGQGRYAVSPTQKGTANGELMVELLRFMTGLLTLSF